MKCSPEFRKRVAEQADLARRGSGRGYTGQLFFTYGEVKWILADLQRLHEFETAAPVGQAIEKDFQAANENIF